MKEDSRRIWRSFWAKAARKITISTTKFICKAALRLFDKGPVDDTKLPIGWIAKGYKEGIKEVGPAYPSKKDFMDNNARCDGTMILRDGRILPK
jgi:hypothetical protein